MKALCMITVKPGMVDKVVQILRKKRKISKDIMVVTGRADISVILNSSIDEINNVVIDLKNVKEIVNTCLLYTSPSPRDLSTSRMPSSA